MTTIDLTALTSLASLSGWPLKVGKAVTFRVGKNADFEPLAEGVALGLLGYYVRENVDVIVECTFDPLTPTLGEFFKTLFGSFLALYASHFHNPGPLNGKAAAQEVRNTLWTNLRSSRGEFG